MKLVFKNCGKIIWDVDPTSASLESKFLKHSVSKEGVKPDPEKICVLKKLKPPTTFKQL